MANQIPLAIADLELQVTTAISVGDESFSVNVSVDDDGEALPAGKYCFTLDSGTSNKEYLIGQLNGTNITEVKSVSRQGVETTGAARAHRVGAPCIVTNFATLQRVADILRGQVELDGSNPLVYDAEPTLSARDEIATVGYVLDNITGGTVAFDAQTIAGNAGETVAAGDLVYFKTSDQEWYLADASVASEVENVAMGFALGSGTDGAGISNGIQISGTFTTTGLTAGSTYYATDTAGTIGTTAGTTNRVVGVALSTTKLLMVFITPETPTSNEKAALAGASNTPSSTNKFVTEDDLSDPTVKPPQVVTFTSSGTWTKDAGLKYIMVEGVGGGGNGSNSDVNRGVAGNSGAAGGYFKKIILASALGATETVTVGAVQGDTSFGSHCSGDGANLVDGGAATGGDINIDGQPGELAGGTGSSSASTKNRGGSNPLGFGGGQNNRHATGYGAGGGGSDDNLTGSNASPGIVIVTEYYS